MNVGQIIDGIIKKTGVEPLPYDKTCDKIVIGSAELEVTGIVSTFMATVEVIKKTIELGANMIITHEPTWFTGPDDTAWLENDPIYLQKKKLLEDHNITVFRFHDHMHMDQEDGIYRGFDREFGWAKYKIQAEKGLDWFGACYEIPQTTLESLALFFKNKLDMEVIQYVGSKEMQIRRVAVLVGGGSLGFGKDEMPMQLMQQNNLDLLICGDITEWTISAYVNDATALGINKGMLVLGHERSEEWGMKYLGDWLEDIVDGIEVFFVDAKEPFGYL